MQGYDMVGWDTQYDSIKAGQCKKWRKVLGTEQTPEESHKNVSSEEDLRLGNNSSFIRSDQPDVSGGGILSSLGKIVNIYLPAELISSRLRI
jgi:hypothetical protein